MRVLKAYLLSPVLVVIIGVSLSLAGGWVIYKAEERTIIRDFQHDLDAGADAIYREVLVNFEALRSISIMFKGPSIPDRERFSTEARKIVSRFDDIQALEWVPRVAAADRELYEQRLDQRFPGFEFTERQQQGVMVRAEARDFHYPVYYIEPMEGNEAAFGFDLSSSPSRLKFLEASRDSGRPLATARITLVQDIGEEIGFLAVLPIYHGAPNTRTGRYDQFKGIVSGVYRIEDIFVGSGAVRKTKDIELRLIDVTDENAPELLFKQSPAVSSKVDLTNFYHTDLPELWGRQWRLQGSPSADYLKLRRSVLPIVAFICGVIFTGAVAFYLYIVTRRATTIRKLVDEQTHELVEANKKLELLSQTDGLTGLANRRLMDEFLDREWLRAIRHRSPISLLIIDIDFFKAYNDHYGHPEGDECLKRVAGKLKKLAHRPGDLVARYGGEEFAVILPDTEKALGVAEHCCHAVEDLRLIHEYSDASEHVTVSIGVCTWVPDKGTDPSILIETADRALYMAKESGRNRVEIAAVEQIEPVRKLNFYR